MNFVLSLADYVFDYKISLRFKWLIIRYETWKTWKQYNVC